MDELQKGKQVLDAGPPVVVDLQCPSTASSGRKLITVSRGGSYLLLPSAWSTCWSIEPPAPQKSRLAPTAAAAARTDARIVQDWQDLMRCNPLFHIHFLAENPAG